MLLFTSQLVLSDACQIGSSYDIGLIVLNLNPTNHGLPQLGLIEDVTALFLEHLQLLQLVPELRGLRIWPLGQVVQVTQISLYLVYLCLDLQVFRYSLD